MKFTETACKTALSRSSLPGLDYSLNPYTGCGHGCIYCYAPATIRYAGPEPWGTFVAAKTNVPVVLERELRKARRGIVGISTVTDPYQPVERRLELTRRCLEVLQAKQFPVCVQTKSALVVRDIDLLRGFREVEVGLTVTTLDEGAAAVLEPGASRPGERLDAMRQLSDAGVTTWAFVGPLVPGFVDGERLAGLLARVKEAGASRVLVDKLRMKPGLWPRMAPALRGNPEGLEACLQALSGDQDVFGHLREQAVRACKELGLDCELCY